MWILFLRKERKWRKWVDEKFIHVISPNVYRTLRESQEAFKWFDKVGDWEHNFSYYERQFIIYMGFLVMYVIGKRLKNRLVLRVFEHSIFN